MTVLLRAGDGDMSIDEIIQKHEELNKKLNFALATFEKKDTIKEIRLQIIENQNQCPHISDKYSWEFVDGKCPYCGREIF